MIFNFFYCRLYMTTSMANPHFLPAVCIRVTLINFTVTFEGLQDQLLSTVVQQVTHQVPHSVLLSYEIVDDFSCRMEWKSIYGACLLFTFIKSSSNLNLNCLKPHCTNYSYLGPLYRKQCLIGDRWSHIVPFFLC